MALYTTAQSGYADEGSTWVGGVAPGAGDLIARAANHTLTFRVSASFGDDPSADTLVIYGPSSGADTGGFIVDGCTHTLYGSMLSGPGGFVTLANGGKIHNQSTNHQCLYISAATSADAYLESTATSWATATEISDESGNGFSVREVPDNYYSGKLIGSYCRFKGIDVIQFQKGFDIHHFIFDAACGNVTPVIAVNNAWDYSIVNCTHLSATSSFIYSVNNSVGTGKRAFHHNVCVSKFAAYCSDNAAMDLTYSFYPGINSNSGTYISRQERCFIIGAVDDPIITSYAGPIRESLIVEESTANPHFVGIRPLQVDIDIDGCIFQYINTYASDHGDLVLIPSPLVGEDIVVTVKNCIELPGKDGILSGVITHFGNEYVKSIIHNNTLLGCSSYGETSGPAVDMTPLYANNIIYTTPEMEISKPVENSFVRFLAGCEGFEGIVTVADFNNGFGSDYRYGLPETADYFGSSPGANDDNTDPEFVDSARDLSSWAVTWGCASGETFDNKVAYAKALIIAANDEEDPNYQADIETLVDDFIDYIRGGFTPTVELAGAGTSILGYTLPAYIGAVEPVLRKVEFTNNSDYASSTIIVPQTVTNWTDTDITINVVPGDLETGPVYVFITSETGIRNAVGYEIEFTLGSSSITDILSSCTLVLTGEDISGLHNNSDTFSGSTYSFGGENIDVYKTYVDVLSSGSFAETGLDLSVLFNYSDVLGENSLSSSFLSIDEIFNYLDNFSANTLSFSSSNISTLRSYSDVLSGEEFSLTVENLLTYNNFQDTLSQLEISFSGENITVTKTYTDNLSELTLLLEVEDISDNYLQSYSDVLSPSSYSYGGLELVTGRVYTDTLSLSTLSFSVSNLVDYKNYSDELNQGSYSSGFDTLNVLKNYTDTLLENSISVTVGEIDFLHNYIDVLSESSNSFSFSSLEVFKNFLDVLSPLELAFSGNSIITELQLVGVTTDNLTGSSFVSDFESISVLRSHLDSLSGNNFEFFVNDISSFHSYTDTLGPDSLSSSVSQIDLFHNYSDIIGNSSYGLSFEDIETTFWDGVYTDVLSNSSFVLSGNNLSIVYNGSLPELWEIVTFINKVSSENVLKINTIEKTFISNLYGVV